MTIASSTPSQSEDQRITEEQINKLCDKVRAGARKARIHPQRVQAALAHPGIELERRILRELVQYADQVSGVVTVVSAQETGLIPYGHHLIEDYPDGEIDFNKLDFSCQPIPRPKPLGGCHWGGLRFINYARSRKAVGSLGLAKAILDQQSIGRRIIPDALKHISFIMPWTLLQNTYGKSCYPVICFGRQEKAWVVWFQQLNDLCGLEDHIIFRL